MTLLRERYENENDIEIADTHFTLSPQTIENPENEPSYFILMNRKEAARYINFMPGTLAVWDCNKRYDLKPIKIGRSVRYRKYYLDKFLESFMTP